MNKSFVMSAVAALLLGGTSARADFIEWSYNWTPSVTTISSETSPDSKVTLSNEPGATASGNSDIVATNITAISNAPRGTPDTFGANSDFSLKLRLTDKASGAFTDLIFSGEFTGTLSGSSANVDVTFASPTEYVVQLGNSIYTVTIGPYSPPGPPSQSTNKGSIGANVQVSPADIAKAPEPSTMALSCVAMSFLGLASWRKRRRAAVVA